MPFRKPGKYLQLPDKKLSLKGYISRLSDAESAKHRIKLEEKQDKAYKKLRARQEKEENKFRKEYESKYYPKIIKTLETIAIKTPAYRQATLDELVKALNVSCTLLAKDMVRQSLKNEGFSIIVEGRWDERVHW